MSDWNGGVLAASLPDIPRKMRYLLIAAPVVFFFVGVFVPPVSADNARSSLMMLGGALASILAIVFSVTILGIQLVATRYTARATSLFTEDPVFRSTFSMFVAAVSLDLLLLLSLPTAPDSFVTAVVFAVGGINLAAIVVLYYFIQSSAKRNTPEGILSSIDEKLTPTQFRSGVKEYLSDGPDTPHPLHAVYGMAISAMSNQESATAEKAVKKLRSITLRALRSLGPEDSKDDTVTEQMFKPVLEDYLPEIAVSATEHGEDTVSRRAVSALSSIAEAGVDTHSEFVAHMGRNGFSDILREADPVEESSGLILRSFTQMSSLIVRIAEKPAPKTTGRMLLGIRNEVDRLFRHDLELWVYRDLMLEYFEDLESIQSSLIDKFGEEIAGQEIDWQSKGLSGRYEGRDAAESLNYVMELVIKSTNSCLIYKRENGENPFVEGNFRDSWKTFCIQSINSPLDGYGVVWTQFMIEVAYCFYLFDEDNQSWWARAVADVMIESDPEKVQEAFERIAEISTYSRRIRIQRPTPVGEERGLIQQAMDSVASPQSFQNWSGEFRESVFDQYRSIREQQND